MATRLHQVVAVLSGKKTRTMNEITEIHQQTQKAALFAGAARTYRPLDSVGEKLPDETQMPPANAEDCMSRARKLWTDYFDTMLTVDTGSAATRGDVVVDGVTILVDVPVLSLIFLEQQLNDIRKFVSSLPVLDPNYEWSWDESKNFYVTKQVEQNRTIKLQEPVILVPATEKHPAQAQVLSVDKWVGVYTSTKFSTAIKASEKREYVDRVDKLINTIKSAREKANSIEVEQRKDTGKIFDYIFGAV